MLVLEQAKAQELVLGPVLELELVLALVRVPAQVLVRVLVSEQAKALELGLEQAEEGLELVVACLS